MYWSSFEVCLRYLCSLEARWLKLYFVNDHKVSSISKSAWCLQVEVISPVLSPFHVCGLGCLPVLRGCGFCLGREKQKRCPYSLLLPVFAIVLFSNLLSFPFASPIISIIVVVTNLVFRYSMIGIFSQSSVNR